MNKNKKLHLSLDESIVSEKSPKSLRLMAQTVAMAMRKSSQHGIYVYPLRSDPIDFMLPNSRFLSFIRDFST